MEYLLLPVALGIVALVIVALVIAAVVLIARPSILWPRKRKPQIDAPRSTVAQRNGPRLVYIGIPNWRSLRDRRSEFLVEWRKLLGSLPADPRTNAVLYSVAGATHRCYPKERTEVPLFSLSQAEPLSEPPEGEDSCNPATFFLRAQQIVFRARQKERTDPILILLFTDRPPFAGEVQEEVSSAVAHLRTIAKVEIRVFYFGQAVAEDQLSNFAPDLGFQIGSGPDNAMLEVIMSPENLPGAMTAATVYLKNWEIG